MKATNVETIELTNGQKVELSINFAALYKLRTVNKSLYEKYNKLLMKGTEDSLDTLCAVYTGYVCANIDNIDKCMTEKEFTELLPYQPAEIMTICRSLLGAKKK